MTSEELKSKTREIDGLFNELVDDVIEVTKIWEQREDELSRRLYVRTVFACVEGVVQVMKSAALLHDTMNDPQELNLKEIVLLKEEDPYISDNGRVGIRKKKIVLLHNFEFAIRVYAKVRGCPVVLDKKEGWCCLQQAIKIRDRLTHPHTKQDLTVSDEEMKIVMTAVKFFHYTTGQLLHEG